jgi:3-methylcrotonyl-CoA carboxylase alpha subunit
VRTSWLDRDRGRTVDVTPMSGGRFRVVVDGVALELEAEALGGGVYRLMHEGVATTALVTAVGPRRFVRIGTLDFVIDRGGPSSSGRSRSGPAGGLESPMPGVVTRVMVTAGEIVKKGQPLLAIEAMKMEHLIRSPRDGKVRELRAKAGEMVSPGVALAELEEEA